MLDTKSKLLETDFPVIYRRSVQTLQVNLGYLCNLSCTHCHVNAGPKRTELMDKKTVDEVLFYIDQHNIHLLDLTGGAPEMNPHFRYLVVEARRRGVQVIDRCNLTILLEQGYQDLAEFFAANEVIVIASLPCYSEQNVKEQRGKGVFQASIEALQGLNQLGYGIKQNLCLDLVYNPNGAFLPPRQSALEADYKQKLQQDFGIVFNQLLTMTNMPISRFGSMLLSKGIYDDYLTLLKDNFSQKNVDNVMCKQLLSIDWQGYVYDCDFNQMLDLPLHYSLEKKVGKVPEVIASDKKRWHLRDLLSNELVGGTIVTGEHCYACTAGQGSSCGGAL